IVLSGGGNSSLKSFASFSPGAKVSISKKESVETERTVDLRGKTIADALDALEDEVDRAVTHSLLKLKIIHGHGTQDRLKKSVRTYLSRSTFVKGWLSGRA